MTDRNLNDLILKLYNRTLELNGAELNTIQSEKFKHACKKSIIENPDLNVSELLISTKIYLGLILDFPELDLGPVVKP